MPELLFKAVLATITLGLTITSVRRFLRGLKSESMAYAAYRRANALSLLSAAVSALVTVLIFS
jgi:hypothetical protein